MKTTGALALCKPSDLFVHELRLDAGLRFRFLDVFLFEISVGLVSIKLFGAIVIIWYISVTDLVCSKAAFIRLNCTDVEKGVLWRGIFVHFSVGNVFVRLDCRQKWRSYGIWLHRLIYLAILHQGLVFGWLYRHWIKLMLLDVLQSRIVPKLTAFLHAYSFILWITKFKGFLVGWRTCKADWLPD